MNIKKIILLVVFFTVNNFYGQNNISIEVTYKKALKSKKDTTAPKYIKGLLYRLKANDSVSIFNRVESMESDAKLNTSYRIATRGSRGTYFKNRKQNVKLRKVETLGEVFLISYPSDEWDIELGSKTKKIGNYLCYNAILTKDDYNFITQKKTKLVVNVWYTPDIPLPFGPSGYDGLPGLVLEVDKGGVFIVADTIKFEKSNSSYKILPPKEGINVTYEEYLKKLFEMYKKMKN
jgi:GLPGLI family protein